LDSKAIDVDCRSDRKCKQYVMLAQIRLTGEKECLLDTLTKTVKDEDNLDYRQIMFSC
jgi:hypothetical protein